MGCGSGCEQLAGVGQRRLSHGFTVISRLFERTWWAVHSRSPALVGGCRPIDLLSLLPEADWEIRHRRQLAPFGLSSEVVVAARRATG